MIHFQVTQLEDRMLHTVSHARREASDLDSVHIKYPLFQTTINKRIRDALSNHVQPLGTIFHDAVCSW
jgi:hypothetical protein